MRFKFLSFLLANVILVSSHPAEAQKPTQLPRIGFIASAGPEAAPNVEPFRRGLRELGYIEGKNILIEYRYRGMPDQTPSLVARHLRASLRV